MAARKSPARQGERRNRADRAVTVDAAIHKPVVIPAQDFWHRIHAGRRHQDLEDAVRQAFEISEELEFLAAALTQDTTNNCGNSAVPEVRGNGLDDYDGLVPKQIVLRVEEAADTVASLAYALSDLLEQDTV